jgi:hypothetical protein
MKKICSCLGLFLAFLLDLQSQSLIIKGRVKCLNKGTNSSKGAENIIVVPTFLPTRSTLTASRPAGYFEFNTGMPFSMLRDKQVSIYALSRCSGCKEIVKRVFISEDQDRQNRNDSKSYVTIKDWMLNTNCEQAELTAFSADSILQLIMKQPQEKLGDISAATAVVGTPSVLNFLTNLTKVVGVLQNQGPYKLISLGNAKINYGQFLLSSALYHSANTGFNFSPSRDMSEAVFWNPSAIIKSKKNNNISVLTNMKNNVKLGGFVKLTEKLYLGAGGIFTMQDETRNAVIKRAPLTGSPNKDTLHFDSASITLKEYAAFISPVYKVNDKLSIGITGKSIWQDIEYPDSFQVKSGKPAIITDSTFKKQHFDVDVSVSYRITNAIQIGVNFMNIAGSQLHSDAFVPRQKNISFQNLRSAGIGLLYKWQRFNIGSDILLTEDGFYDATIGLNYVPFNNALISAGVAVKQLGYSLSFRLKHFRIAYINDNDWMVNEKRKGKYSILNGAIYSGFVFDFN